MKTIPYTVIPGGSPTGLSYYTGWSVCPRKATLNEEAREAAEITSSNNSATTIGWLMHAYLETYYDTNIHPDWEKLELFDAKGEPSPVDEDIHGDVLRYFNAYKARFAPDELGEVLGLEIEYPDKRLPPNLYNSQENRIAETMLVNPFSTRIDIAVDIDTTTAQGMQKTRSINIEPGIYIVDHKTAARRLKTEQEKWDNSMQMAAMFHIWNALNPDKPARGVLINSIYKLKMPDFRTFVTYPSEESLKKVQSFLIGVVAMKNALPDWPNNNACMQWGRMCYWGEIGRCLGY
jgi:hypothetical protein